MTNKPNYNKESRTMIIRFYDDEGYNYNLIKISDDSFNEFKKIIEDYQQTDCYNFDDFISLIENKEWFIDLIKVDQEVFF